MTPVTYSDLTELLSVDLGTLRHAVSRGVLTRLPKQGLVQPFIKEQAMLFRGKKRLSLNSLNASERVEWARFAQLAQGNPGAARLHGEPVVQDNLTPAITQAAIAGAGAGAALAMAGMLSTGATIAPKVEVPQGNPFQVLLNLLKNTQSQAG